MATWSQAAPALEPVTLDEVKDHLRLSGTAEDVYLEALIKAARQEVEAWTGRAMISRAVTLDLAAWETVSPIPLLFPPVASITSVTGYSNDAVGTTVTSANYFLTGSRLAQAPNTAGWSSEAERAQLALRVVYSAGYGSTTETVPMGLRQAVMMYVADLYETRQSEVVGTIVARSGLNWQSMASPYRVNKLTEVY